MLYTFNNTQTVQLRSALFNGYAQKRYIYINSSVWANQYLFLRFIPLTSMQLIEKYLMDGLDWKCRSLCTTVLPLCYFCCCPEVILLWAANTFCKLYFPIPFCRESFSLATKWTKFGEWNDDVTITILWSPLNSFSSVPPAWGAARPAAAA